ncbi:MAG: SLC13 family permease [Candidatus Hodarchaeales archaeon]
MVVALDPLHVVLVFIIFLLTYIGIINPKFDKTLAALLGAVAATIVLIFLRIPDSHSSTGYVSEQSLLHFTDASIIALIIGTLIIVDIAQSSGVFHFLAIKILKASKGDPQTLLIYFGILTLILSALVNNISAMMIVGSLTILACERLDLDPKPYIITELSMTTAGGIMTLVSSVPNIIISQPFEIDFVTFLIIGAPLGIITMIISFVIFIPMFNIRKAKDPELMRLKVEDFDEWSAVKSSTAFHRSIVILSLTILGFVFSQQLGVSLAMVAVAGGVIMIVTSGKKLEYVFEKLDWHLVAFFLGLFVLINALDVVHILDFIAEQLAAILPADDFLAGSILLWFISIISGIVDNIVVAAAFGPILHDVAITEGYSQSLFAWAAIFGANFGGGITPIGAPSAVVGLSILYRKTGKKISWGEFIKTQGLATVARLVITTVYLGILLSFGFF